MDTVTVLTPLRKFTIRRSRYGTQQFFCTSEPPRPAHRLYQITADADERKLLETKLTAAKEALDTYHVKEV